MPVALRSKDGRHEQVNAPGDGLVYALGQNTVFEKIARKYLGKGVRAGRGLIQCAGLYSTLLSKPAASNVPPKLFTLNFSYLQDDPILACVSLDLPVSVRVHFPPLLVWWTQPPAFPENVSRQAKDFLSNCLIIDPDRRMKASELLEHAVSL